MLSSQFRGATYINAAVPSPAINVLCAGMTADELTTLIYNRWPEGQKSFNATTWDQHQPGDIPDSFLNRTVVDDLFTWGPQYGQHPPIFGKLPEPYNTIVNKTGQYPANAIYLLAASPPGLKNPQYSLCALRVKQTGVCSTSVERTGSLLSLDTLATVYNDNIDDSDESSMSTILGQPNDVQYNRHDPNMKEGVWVSDWKDVASTWASAMDLNSGN